MKSKKEQKVEEPQKQYHQLGDQESMEAYEASKDGGVGVYRIDYKKADNIFALVSPAWLSVQEHWIRIGENNHKLVCAVHVTNDEQKIMNRWGYPDGCPFCEFKSRIFEETDKDDKDPVVLAQRKIAKDIASSLTTYMFAIQGEAAIERKRGKRISVPDFENMVVKRLALSRDAFGQFFDTFKDSGLSSNDVIGLPVNFIVSKKEGQSFSSVQRIELYPEHNIKTLVEVMPTPPDNMFGNLDSYDPVAMEKVFKEFSEAFDDMVTGIVANAKSKKTTKVKKQKK